MAAEFQNSSHDEETKLHLLRPSTLRGYAEKTDDTRKLERLLHAAVSRAIADEFSVEADETAIFINEKLQSIIKAEHDQEMAILAAAQRLKDEDTLAARSFFEIFPYYYADDDPKIVVLELEHEALFKQQ